MLGPGIDDDVARRLVTAAVDARDRAHAPYSDFRAGAAVLTATGDVVSGALVENISLGLSMCAERVAMFAAATATPSAPGLRALVVAAPDTGPRLTWPCGACRQVAAELGDADMLVAAVGEQGGERDDITWRALADLLPDAPRRRG